MATDTLENMLDAFYRDDDNDFFNLELANNIVAAYPQRAEAHAALARAYDKLDAVDEAKQATRAALRLDPACPDALRIHANILEDRDDALDEANRILDATLKQHPNHYGCLLARGYSAVEHGDADLGIPLLLRAAKAQPSFNRPLANLAFFCAEHGRPGELIAAANAIEAHHPLTGEQLYNVGTALHEMEHYDKAIGYLDRSRALLGAENAIQHNRALCLEALTRYQDAIDEWSILLEHEPEWDWPLEGRVRCQRKLGNNAAALADVTRLIALDPQNKKARQYEVGIHYDLDDYPKMLAAACVLTAHHPDDAWGHNMHGISLRETREPKKARAAFLRAIEIDDTYLRAHHNLAALELAEARFADAQKHAEYMIALDPTMWEAHHLRARALLGLARNQEATQVYTNWLAQHPDDGDARVAYAEHLRDIQDWKPALAAYECIFDRLNPKAYIAWHVGECHQKLGNVAAATEWFNKAKAQYMRDHDQDGIGYCDRSLKSLTAKPGLFSKLFG